MKMKTEEELKQMQPEKLQEELEETFEQRDYIIGKLVDLNIRFRKKPRPISMTYLRKYIYKQSDLADDMTDIQNYSWAISGQLYGQK